MAYVAPTVRSVGDAVTAADYNIMANDMLDHESLIGTFRVAPTSWTPTMSGGWLNGNSTTEGRYYKAGLMVWCWGKITLGSTATKSVNPMELSIPVTAAAYTDYRLYASSFQYVFEDFGANVYYGHGGDPGGNTATTVRASLYNTSSTYAAVAYITSTQPFTWGTSDVIMYSGFYQAAS